MVEVPDKLPAKRAKKKNTGVIVLVIAVIIALVIAGIGFYFYKTQEMENEQRAYENAMMSDQPAVLQNYLDMYAEAPKAHRESVEAHLTSLKKIDTDWTNACVMCTKADLEKYMKLHPQSIHNTEALLLIDSLD